MEKKKYRVGYTQGTYDLFHVGHLNLLEHAKEQCEYLIVGINSDELVMNYKGKKTNIRAEDRARIVEALKVVDEVHIVPTLDKLWALNKFKFDAIFIGDDWRGNSRWEETGRMLGKKGIDLVFLPHTDGISTTQITRRIQTRGQYTGGISTEKYNDEEER